MFDKKPRFIRNKVVSFFASIRFAIPVLMAYTTAMIVGTVLESLYGTDFATVAVYRSSWFYAILAAIALSVFLAMVDRIPFRKRLTGFYIIHCGLITILVGGLITRYWGIDGSIEIAQAKFTSQVNLAEDRIYVEASGGEQLSTPLLPAIKPVEFKAPTLLTTREGVRVEALKYLPYAKPETIWRPQPGVWISEWTLSNERFTQPVEFSNVAVEGITTGGEVGALRVEVLAPELFSLLSRTTSKNTAGDTYLFFDSHSKTALKLDAGKLATGKPQTLMLGGAPCILSQEIIEKIGLSVLRLRTEGSVWSFFPRFSAAPITKHLQTDEKSTFRIYDLGSLRKKSSLFLSRDSAGKVSLGYGKGTEWKFMAYPGRPVDLPWMGLSIELRGQKIDQAPETLFVEGTANKDSAKNIKAVLLKVETPDGRKEERWASDRGGARSRLAPVELLIGKEAVHLPFEMSLEQFKMDQIPGTGMPASYESFVKVRDRAPAHTPATVEPPQSKTVHIYMNNPYKAAGFTLYQSSYFQDERGAYHSVLSVNRDPGRAVKYAGALLLVLGLIIHYLVIHRKASKAS